MTGRQGRTGIDPDVMQKRDEISAQFVVDFLNELVRLDKYALTDLMTERVRVSKQFTTHPTVPTKDDQVDGPEIGMLGVINGMFGLEGETQAIEVVIDKHTDVIIEFRLTEPWRGWTEPPAA
jgi:calcineurin-like phosphoesterase